MATYHACKQCGWTGFVNGRPRCLACYRRYVTKWRRVNPEKYREQKSRYDKRFRRERREEYNAKRRRYRQRQTNAAAWQRRKEWLATGNVTRDELIGIYNKHDGRCAYCGGKVVPRYDPLDPRGFDHVKPRAKRGEHAASNIVVCCRRCNAEKRDS